MRARDTDEVTNIERQGGNPLGAVCAAAGALFGCELFGKTGEWKGSCRTNTAVEVTDRQTLLLPSNSNVIAGMSLTDSSVRKYPRL